MIATLERMSLTVTRGLSVVGLVALLLLAAMTLADGLARWLLNAPIEGVRDVGALVIAVAVACLLPVGLAERSHITIRVAESVVGGRAARWLDAAAALLVTAIMAAICWQFVIYAGKIAQANETTWILKWPRAPFWYAVAAILAVAVAVQAIACLRQLADLNRRDA
jgi:TRAP-type C4-dicarboxylate transport system permease small subunit